MNQVDYSKYAEQLLAAEAADFSFRERRHSDWDDNYLLFRNRVITNRLTQRQSAVMPLMKGVINTVRAKTDEMVDLEFNHRGNDQEASIALNAYWQEMKVLDKLYLKDAVDKKQDYLYGRTFRKLNIANGRIITEVKESYDILLDRYTDPTDVDESADHYIERGIFRTIGELESNPSYNPSVVAEIKKFYGTQLGLVKAEENASVAAAKNQRLSEMGDKQVFSPLLGHAVVELKAFYKKIWDTSDKEFHIHVIIMCDGKILMGKPLKEILGIDFFPFITWADDPERNDLWSDAIADTVRVPNQILNAWISQLVENRTLRNMGMNFYDAAVAAQHQWSPSTFQPMPFGWYPLPGKPSDVFQKVEIPDLSESLDEIQYVTGLVEKATAATSTLQGEASQQKITLGEIQIAVGNATERITSISKFNTPAQVEYGTKWAAMVMANGSKLNKVKLYKKGYAGNFYANEIDLSKLKAAEGYQCEAVSQNERKDKSTEAVQKLQAIAAQFPGNPAMAEIYKQKLLDFGGLNPEERAEVMNYEKQAQDTRNQQPQLTPPQNGQPATGVPGLPGPIAG